LVWDASEDLTAFEMSTGRRIDAWEDRLLPERSYALMLAADLSVTPEPKVSTPVCGGRFKLYLLPAGWPEDIRVYLGDNLVWEPYLRGGRPPPPEWARVSVDVDPPRTLSFGSRLRLEIRAPLGVRIDGLRMDQHP